MLMKVTPILHLKWMFYPGVLPWVQINNLAPAAKKEKRIKKCFHHYLPE